MAIETTFTVRASAKGFSEAKRAVEDLNKALREGEGSATPGGPRSPLPNRPSAPRPSAATPQPGPGTRPRPRLPPGYEWNPDAGPNDPVKIRPIAPGRPGALPRPGTGPGVLPMPLGPGSLPTPGGTSPGSAPDAPGKRRRPRMKKEDVDSLTKAYLRAIKAGEKLVGTASDINHMVAEGLPTFKEFAELAGQLGRGRGPRMGGGGGGGGSGGGGGGPRGPAVPAPAPPSSPSNRAALLQGLLEGVMPGFGMMQRGPGVMAQFAGRTLGNFGRSVAQIPRYGAAGIVDAASSVPLIGGILGGAASQMYGNAGTAISFEASQQAQLPYLGSQGVNARNLRGRGLGGLSFNNLSKMGMRYGMGGQQAQGYLASLAQASGSTADNAQVQGLFGSSMAANQAFGIGPEVAGLYAQGARMQGSGPGVGANGFIRNLAQAQQGLGLSGTELTDYMRQMAEDIASFKDTGIPLRTDTIGALGTQLASSGIAGARAGQMANSFVRNAQNVGNEGPQSVEDYALMQAVNGKPLRGISDSIAVMKRLEMGLSPDEAKTAFGNLRAGAASQFGSDEVGQFEQRRYLRRFGVNLNSREFSNLGNGQAGDVTDQQAAAFNMQLNQTAQSNTSTALQKQSGLDNANLAIGQQGLGSYFMAEQASKQIAAGVVQGMTTYVTQVNKTLNTFMDFVMTSKTAERAMSPYAGLGMGPGNTAGVRAP